MTKMMALTTPLKKGGTIIYHCVVRRSTLFHVLFTLALTPPKFHSAGAVFLMLIPHPSLLIVLVFYHLKILHSPIRFVLHLLGTYTLTFLAFCSLILLLARDPGPVVRKACNAAEEEVENEHEDEISLTQALLAVEDGPDLHPPGMWCHKCSAPRPERAHHCRTCGRCVLKMGMFLFLDEQTLS